MDIPRMGLPDRLTARLSMSEQHELLTRHRGHRRRSVLAAGAAVAAGAVAAGVPANAASATVWQQPTKVPGKLVVPFGRHLAWGPNPRSQVRVGWQVPHAVHRPFLRVGDAPINRSRPRRPAVAFRRRSPSPRSVTRGQLPRAR
ncbi:hypothetical protein [Paractinoplanes durhamensis]|uniref:hypothetical protein n=1 Tax=Paractinoplanes durhamensis TaxID=113563 RepID=UPI00362BFC7B